MIKNPKARINFSDKDKTILLVNHNYFVRTAIATLADMFLTSLIITIIGAVVTGILLFVGALLENSDTNIYKIGNICMFLAIILDICLGIFYFFYVIVKIARISKMRKHVNRIEGEIISNSTADSGAEEDQAE